jgi:hypothetical protein
LPGFNLQGTAPAGLVGEYLQQALNDQTFQYVREVDEATGIAALVRAAAGLVDPGDLATANGMGAGGGGGGEEGEQVRIINGAVKRGDEPHRLALEAKTDYTLEVWIGVQSEESITEPSAPAFPAHELPAGPQQIDVILTCLDNREEVQKGQVTLPERGDSDRVKFVVNFARPGTVFGRMALAHGGRVLQTAILRADVVAERPSRLGRPSIEVEEVIRASFAPVSEADEFDLAVVVNRDSTGKRTASAIRKEGVTIRSVDGLSQQITELKDALTSIADDPDAFASMTSEDTLTLLFDLANLGEGLHNAFVKDHGIKANFFQRGRLQIISAAADSYLPVELFYALRPPTEAKLCKNWKKSVLAGTCASCEALGADDDIPICLTGFWGVRYVVERHVHDPKFARLTGDYRLQNEPGAGRDQLQPLESILWGLSDNVQATDRSSLTKALSKKNFAATKAKTWTDFQDRVAELDPSMVFLLPHTDMKGRLFATEIGGELEQVNLLGRRLNEPREKKFVAVLLGCDTAHTDIPFQGMVPRFRQAGAAVVVTTINTILGRHAVPVAKELLRLLKGIGTPADDRSMGDVMRDLRRQALADGYPMILSVVAFGDADWRLTA